MKWVFLNGTDFSGYHCMDIENIQSILNSSICTFKNCINTVYLLSQVYRDSESLEDLVKTLKLLILLTVENKN